MTPTTPGFHGEGVDGWLVLDKPIGLTSTQALGKARRLLGARKAGHAGTLDPLASGILPIAFGEATKTIPFIQDATKTYDFALAFGFETTTDDLEGAPINLNPDRPETEALQAVLARFVGEIDQVPPAFSAIHVAGARAYDLARAGHPPVLPARAVRIDALTLVERPSADLAHLRVTCGKGTYVRALARDIGRALDCRGHVAWLRRIQVGPFLLGHTIGLERLAELDYKARVDQALHPVETALDDIPALAITGSEARRLRQGLPISPGGRLPSSAWSCCAAFGPEGLVALLAVSGDDVRPIRVFNLKRQRSPDVDLDGT